MLDHGAVTAPEIRGLGEIALRTRSVDRLREFYERVLGFEVFAAFEGVTFLTVAPGEPGHPQALALFDADWPSTREGHGWSDVATSTSPLHHFALSIAFSELAAWEARLNDEGVAFNRRCFDWVGWRSLFFQDPDGNVVELVAVDPSLRPTAGGGA